MADDDTTPITPDRSRPEAPDTPATPDASGAAETTETPGTPGTPDTPHAEHEAAAVAAGPATAPGLEPEPVARPGWRSRLSRVPRTPAIAGGVLALVLLAGGGGFALGHATGDRDGHRPPWDGERVSEGVPGMPGLPGDGDGRGPGHGLPPAGVPQAPQGVLPGGPAVPPPGVQDDDGDGDDNGDGADDGAGADSGTDAS